MLNFYYYLVTISHLSTSDTWLLYSGTAEPGGGWGAAAILTFLLMSGAKIEGFDPDRK